jgi:hypothetical protein
MAEQEEGIENVSFLDGLISQETRRRTREHTQPFIDACCTPGCVRSTVLTVGIASLLLTALLIIIFLARSNSNDTPILNPKDPPTWLLNQVTEAQLKEHIQFLSSDLLEGRAPGTRGEQLTTGYIASHFLTAGLKPINDTFIHNVPMRGLTVQSGAQLYINGDNGLLNLTYANNYTSDSDLDEPNIAILNVPMVFGGNCLYSQKYGTIPFTDSDVDMAGTIVICLAGPITYIHSPDFYSVSEYYASVSYKLAYLRSLAVRGVLMVHTEASTGYSWDVFQNRFGAGEQLALQNSSDTGLLFKGWITSQVADSIAKLNNASSSLLSWIESATTTQFMPSKLHTKFTQNVTYAVRQFDAQLVLGYLGPAPKWNSVLVMAHHDNLGMRAVAPPTHPSNSSCAPNDTIYNGAVDNASGVSGLLATAYAIGALYKEPFIIHPGYDPPPLLKTIIFMSTTGRENMLGTTYFTKTNFCDVPLCGANLVFDFDVMNMWGSALDFDIVGTQMSTLVSDIAAASIAAEDLKSVTSGVGASLGDAWPFILNNCSAVTFATVSNQDPNPIVSYMANQQYRPCDKYSDNLNMTGLVQQIRVTLRVVYTITVNYPTPQLTQSFVNLLQEIKNVLTL